MRMNPSGAARDERGAAAVMVALLMVVVLSMTAFTVDYGKASLEKARLQNHADSAALSIARDCALRKPTCTEDGGNGLAASLAAPNASTGSVAVTSLSAAGGQVKVAGTKTVPFAFASVMGRESTVVRVRSGARWDSVPVEGAPILPIAIGWCTYQNNLPESGKAPVLVRTDLSTVLDFRQDSCAGPPGRGTVSSSRYGYWYTSLLGLGGCRYSTSLDARVTALLGSLITPPGCLSAIGDLKVGDTVLLPITTTSTWVPALSQLTLRVEGFAAVRISAKRFYFVLPLLGTSYAAESGVSDKCSNALLFNPCQGISVTFTRTATKDASFTYGTDPGGRVLGPVNPTLTTGD
ncbi:MAG: Tad domain-containing protein [Nocardioidaceae bacterium]|nr:Tad domain-containing protein [Nocardioidaceae bacterium]